MKNCTHCKHAQWTRTAAGKLHPSGDGRCGFEVKIPTLPASKRWGYMKDSPTICGGQINRRRELSDHCVYYSRQEVAP